MWFTPTPSHARRIFPDLGAATRNTSFCALSVTGSALSRISVNLSLRTPHCPRRCHCVNSTGDYQLRLTLKLLIPL
jgi:hypothetical protein